MGMRCLLGICLEVYNSTGHRMRAIGDCTDFLSLQLNLSQAPPEAHVPIDSLAQLLVDAGMEDVVSLDMTAVQAQRDCDTLLLATGRSPQHAFAGMSLVQCSGQCRCASQLGANAIGTCLGATVPLRGFQCICLQNENTCDSG